MLKKIVLKNVTSYKLKPVEVEFTKKISLFYGLNGTGKTTISNYLSSIGGDAYKDCEIFKELDDSFHVYNQKYANETFVDVEGLPGIFTLSKDNHEIVKAIKEKDERRKEVAQIIDSYTKEKTKINDDFLDKKQKVIENIWKIKASYAGGDRVLEFCLAGNMGSKNALFDHVLSYKKIDKCEQTVDELKKEANDILVDAQKIEPIKGFVIDSFSNEEKLLLEKEIVGNSNSSVSSLIKKLKNNDWVRDGLVFIDNVMLQEEGVAQCPFCQENTITERIVNSISDYFDEEYERDVALLKEMLRKIDNQILDLPEESVLLGHKKISSQKEEFLIKYRELKTVLEENKKKIGEKIKSPALQVTLISFSEKLIEINDIIDNVNKLVEQHNLKIDKADDTKKNIKKNFWLLMRFNHDVEIELLNHDEKKMKESTQKINDEIIKNKVEESSLKEEISNLQKKTVNIDEAMKNVSSYLKSMGISHFELVKHGDSTYRLEREGDQKKIYQSLSEGEKTIITFLFFLEQCKGRKSPDDVSSKKIIVIDDPISSLSHMYVFNVSRLIKTEFFGSENFEQIIVLTHSLYFFHELAKIKKNDEDEINQEFFRVHKNLEGTQIIKMKSSEIQNDYQSYWSVIKDEAAPPALLANCMRNILEHYFGFVQAHESINNIFQQSTLKDNKFQAFLRYMDRGSHSNVTNISDFKEIDHNLFKEAFKLVFEENNHGGHYKKMMKA